jgi:hypothetical protein
MQDDSTTTTTTAQRRSTRVQQQQQQQASKHASSSSSLTTTASTTAKKKKKDTTSGSAATATTIITTHQQLPEDLAHLCFLNTPMWREEVLTCLVPTELIQLAHVSQSYRELHIRYVSVWRYAYVYNVIFTLSFLPHPHSPQS